MTILTKPDSLESLEREIARCLTTISFNIWRLIDNLGNVDRIELMEEYISDLVNEHFHFR